MLRISSGDEKGIDLSTKVSVNMVTEIQNLFSNYQFNTSPPPPSNALGLLKAYISRNFLQRSSLLVPTWHGTKIGAKIQSISFIL